MIKNNEGNSGFFRENILAKLSANAVWKILLIACITILLAFSLPGLASNYSFWIDELYTVQFISGNWTELLSKHVLPDTNPPLYFAIAKIWVSMTGLTEGSLRTLSLFFSLATLIYFWCQCKREQSFGSAVALILMSTNSYFLYYAQEARSYSALILLTSVLTFESTKVINHISNRRRLLSTKLLITITTLALSITHYFGFIFAFTTSMSRVFFARKKDDVFREIKLAVAMLIWPILHLGVYGYLNESQLERIALKPQPWWFPIQSFSISNLPYLNSGLKIIDAFYAIFAGAIIILSLAIALKIPLESNSENKATTNNLIFTLSILLIGLLGISLANQLTPISTFRNFVVFLAPTSIMFGSCWDIIINRSREIKRPRKTILSAILQVLIGIEILLSLKIGQLNIQQKIVYGPNYKLLAEAIYKYKICKNGCFLINHADEDPVQLGPLSYYFDSNQLISSGKSTNLEAGEDLPLIGYQLSNAEVEELRMIQGNRDLIKVCQKQTPGFKNYSIILIDNPPGNSIVPKNLCPE